MSHRIIILIAGPTASGKSALAMDLARKTGGVIINADAMQLYAGLPVLTAQPEPEEQKEVPHALYGVLDPREKSSAGKWLALAREAVEAAVRDSRMPILVGGTGLYFRAFLGGLADIPEIPAAVRAEVEALYDELGEEKFRIELAKLDPETAQRLARNDRQRSIRAYEVAKHTGKTLGEWHTNGVPTQASIHFPLQWTSAFAGVTLSIEPHLLMPPREELYAACDRRFEKMIARGAVDEVKAFLKRDLDPALPAMKTIGVRELGAYLSGECTLDEAIAKARQMTRNYAKRQMTWFRNQWA